MMDFKYPEGATPIDPDEGQGLLLTHISTRAELDRWEQDNIVEALAWLDKTRPVDVLNEQFVKELHRRMFCHVWKWAGHFRKSDKNIGGSWHQVAMSVRNLCDDFSMWMKLKEDSQDEMAVRFHHRLVSIHPFANGNGRHARLMTDTVLENILNRPRFTWGNEDLLRSGESQRKYIAALQAADRSDFTLLNAFVRA